MLSSKRMSDTKYSSSGNPSDSWLHEFYNPGAPTFDGRDQVSSESTAISTIAPGSMTTNVPSHHGSSSNQYLNLPVDQGGGGGGGGGRGSKPIRRRSRASRRTPTTLLNTDTTNFRAMVQQFTGGPATPYASTASGSHAAYMGPRGGSNFNFGLDARNQALNPTPPPSFYHLQFQQQQRQQQQQQEQHEQYFQNQPHQPYMFSFMNNSRPDMEDTNEHAGAGGFSVDHIPYSLPRPPSSMP